MFYWWHPLNLLHVWLVAHQIPFQPVSGLLWWAWIRSNYFWIQKTSTAVTVVRSVLCHFFCSAPLVAEVTYCIIPSGQGYGVLVCTLHSHSGPASASLASPAIQQPCSPHPLLIPQSHQARFLEDAISSTSTRGAGELCSCHACSVIDQVCCLLTGFPSPSPPCPSDITPLPASPPAANYNTTQKQTPPNFQHSVTHTSLPSLHLSGRPPAVHLPSLPVRLTKWA